MAKDAKEATVTHSELANALVQAIEAAKPPAKKNPFNRTKRTPWTPKDASPKLKLKRKVYHHGVLVDAERANNEEIDLMNKIRPGSYCDGFVQVIRRRDKGLNIDYSIKTASQKLRLVNQFGIRNFKELLEYLIDEASRPKKTEYEQD